MREALSSGVAVKHVVLEKGSLLESSLTITIFRLLQTTDMT